MCVNEPYNFDFKATDADGDSLIYKLCVPKAGLDSITPVISDVNPAKAPPYQDIIFQFPYNLNNLMGGVPLKIDLHTGKLYRYTEYCGSVRFDHLCWRIQKWSKIGEVRICNTIRAYVQLLLQS